MATINPAIGTISNTTDAPQGFDPDPYARWRLLQENFRRAGLLDSAQSGGYTLVPLPEQHITQPSAPQQPQLFGNAAPAPLPQVQTPLQLPKDPEPVEPYTWANGLADMMDAWNRGQKRGRNGLGMSPGWPFGGAGGGNAPSFSDWGVDW